MSGRDWTHKRTRRKSLLKRLFERHQGQCAHCGKQCVRAVSHEQHANTATIDHYPIPRCRLPVSEWFNDSRAVLACFECNNGRGREMQLAELETAA